MEKFRQILSYRKLYKTLNSHISTKISRSSWKITDHRNSFNIKHSFRTFFAMKCATFVTLRI